jgi:pilus assembly protein CpaB
MQIKRGAIMILVSVVAGATAVFLAARWMGRQQNERTDQLVVASIDLDTGVTLNDAMLKAVAWPSSAVPDNSFKDLKSVTGRVIRSPVFKGELILEPKLAPKGTPGGLPSIIQEGKRAISVKVNEVVGVAGFALPGSFVDVMVNTTDSKDKSVSKIVLSNILVLAIAQDAKLTDAKPKIVNAVTLEVTPTEAEKLDLARSVGTLSLILRNPIDRQDVETIGIRREDLLGSEGEMRTRNTTKPNNVISELRPRPSGTVSVEVIRGVQKGTSDF